MPKAIHNVIDWSHCQYMALSSLVESIFSIHPSVQNNFIISQPREWFLKSVELWLA